MFSFFYVSKSNVELLNITNFLVKKTQPSTFFDDLLMLLSLMIFTILTAILTPNVIM